MKGRIPALLLFTVFALTSLYGCSKNSSMTSGQLSSSDNENNQNLGRTMGRFMEHKITLPEIEGQDNWIIKILENKENQIELYAYSDGEYICYRLKNDYTWESSVPEWLNNDTIRNSNHTLIDLCIGNDGIYYGIFTDYNNVGTPDKIIKSVDGKTIQEVEIPYLEEGEKEGDNTYYPSIGEIQVLKDGSIILHDLDSWRDDKLIVCSSDGTIIDKIRIGKRRDFKTKDFITSDNYIIAVNEDGSGVMFYDPLQHKVVQTTEFSDDGSNISFALMTDGTLLMGNGSGMHRLPKDGSLWETTVDGSLNSMSMPTLSFEKLYVIEGEQEEEYYAVYMTEDYEYQLMHYTYDYNVVSVPPKEITVYSLKENKTIRQGLILFQAKNTDVKVNYVVAMNDNTGNMFDYIRVLNTELLAGNGADILVLDDLPADSYIEKGVLSDISDIIKPLEENNDLLINISACYHNTENKVYQYPLRISVPFMVGDPDAIRVSENITSIADYIDNNKAKPYLSETTYRQLLEDYLSLYSKELFENNKLKEEGFITFLKTVKKIADNSHIVEMEENEFMQLFQGDILSIPKKSQVSMFQVQNIYDTMLLFAAIRDTDMELESINHCFLSSGMIGLNSKAKEPEIAKQFIQFLFEREVQAMNAYDGFPVNEGALEEWINQDDVMLTMGTGNTDGDYLSGNWPEKEERELIHKMILNLEYSIDMDFMLKQIIITPSISYLKGEINESQVVAEVSSKVNTYLAEK